MENQFSENLKRIRKEHNLSQEQLADELGVSRQAVSKWESGAAYPEMDKIILLCKKFNLNIDDLLHNDIKEVKEEKDTKTKINNYINEFLKYVTDSVNMFSKMSTGTKIKCIFEQFVIAMALLITSAICIKVLNGVFFSILNLLPTFIQRTIGETLHAILTAFFFFASLVIMGHLFKKRYLDLYYKDNKEEKLEPKKEEKVSSKKTSTKKDNVKEEIKEEKIIIRNEKKNDYSLANGIVKAIIIFVKFILICISISICASLVGFSVAAVLSFLLYKTGAFFFGLLSIFVSCASIAVVFLILIYSFVLNRRLRKRGVILHFILSVILFGVGCGLVSYGSLQFKVIEDSSEYLKVETREHDMRDDLTIHHYGKINYVEEDRDNIKIDYYVVKYCEINEYINEEGNEISAYPHCNDPLKIAREYIKLLNDKKVVPFEDEENITVYANHNNIEKLKNNWETYKESRHNPEELDEDDEEE